jgi:hypothetical protein
VVTGWRSGSKPGARGRARARSAAWVARYAALCATTSVLASGCADFDTSLDPSGGAPDVLVPNPSFEANVQPILDKRCAAGGCHSLATRQAGLSLVRGVAYDAIVGVPSTLAPSLPRVSPSQPDSSWLVTMISADDVARRGRSRMPLATQPLTANQIATIVRWIEQGAQRN